VRYIGTQGELGIGWQATRHLNFRATYSLFKPGQFIAETGPAKTVHFVSTILTRQPHGQC
jgi:hypothetical protein